MNVALSVASEPVDDDRQQQQEHHRSPFALPLPSPERERRAQRTPSFDQLKSPMTTHATQCDTENPVQQLQLQIEKLKEALQVMRVEKDTEIAFLREQLTRQSTRSTPRLVPWMHSITDKGDIQTSRLGRHASLQSMRALVDLQTQQQQQHNGRPGVVLAERMAAAFLNPVLSLPYLHSIQFGADLVELSAHAGALFEAEARCLSLTSPVYVIGDIHGNWTDLSFFTQHLWRFGFGLTAGTFLFLGDYVDRGPASLECVAYLFAHKVLFPHKVVLLRGNHETRAVNGLEHYYGSSCFLSQCRARFGRDEGYIVWHQINHAFDRLPLAATIDQSVFCVHGGIPRSLPHAMDTRLVSIARLPATAPMDVLDKKFYDTNPSLRMVSDMLWADPAREDHEAAIDPLTGFGPSIQRGGSAVSYGTKAVADFLREHPGLTHIVRAHEANVDGIGITKSAQVITVFSTSKDHALGDDATCGCVLVDRDRIVAINRSAWGSQHAVRRRRSVTSLQSPPPVPNRSAQSSRDHADDGVSSAFATAASPTSIPRRQTVQREASATSATAQSPSAPAPRRRRSRQDQDDADSTDDEAPSGSSTSSSSSSSSNTVATGTQRQARRPLSPGTAAENNQAED